MLPVHKQNLCLIIVILLAIAVGYAAFSANITISGTATASGTWDVKFLSASVDTSSHGTANVTGDKNDTLSVNVTLDCEYSGTFIKISLPVRFAKSSAYTQLIPS